MLIANPQPQKPMFNLKKKILEMKHIEPIEPEQHHVITTPRFDDEEDKENQKVPEITVNKSKIDQKKLELDKLLKENSMANNFLDLNESALLEYSMEMSKQFKGLLNNNESTLVNDTLNTSKQVGIHKHQYSNDTSFMFGKDLNESMGLFAGNDNDISLNMKDQELEFKKLIDDDEFDSPEIKKPIENPFLRQKSGEDSIDSRGRSNSPELGRSAFNPFKSPVVPEAIDNSKLKNKPTQNQPPNITKKNSKEESPSKTGEIKIVHDQYSEWNKRIKKAIEHEDYYNDNLTKVHKREPSNPFDNLSLEGMKNMDGVSLKNADGNRKYLRHLSSKESMPANLLPGSNNSSIKTVGNDSHTLFVSFNNSGLSEIPKKSKDEDTLIKSILSIEILLIMVNTDLVSDFEVNRSKRYLKELLEKDPECIEAHYGLSQVYFSLGLYNKALEEINIALQNNKSDIQYLTWK